MSQSRGGDDWALASLQPPYQGSPLAAAPAPCSAEIYTALHAARSQSLQPATAPDRIQRPNTQWQQFWRRYWALLRLAWAYRCAAMFARTGKHQ